MTSDVPSLSNAAAAASSKHDAQSNGAANAHTNGLDGASYPHRYDPNSIPEIT